MSKRNSTKALKRVVILGGGFAGAYTAMALEKLTRGRDDIEVVLVSRENYLVFQPMLPEVISGGVGPLDTVSPLRRLVPKTKLYIREVEKVDLAARCVELVPGLTHEPTSLEYDHLVVALGNVTDFRRVPGLHDHAMPFKNLGDALRLRDHLIHVLNEAAVETNAEARKRLLTFVIGGGGFSGVETCAELNDFVRRTGRKNFGIDENEIRVVLVHSDVRILKHELPESLGRYAQKIMQQRGVQFIFSTRLESATPDHAILNDGQRIPTATLISTVPSSPNPLVDAIDLPKNRGHIEADKKMQVAGHEGVWALGDCAVIPRPGEEGFCPPTAQFAIRQGATCAKNIVATIDGGPLSEFTFTELGKMASLGRRRAIAQLFGRFNLHGFLAWVFWRAVYWAKMPGFDRKLKVGASWLLELVIPPELVQTKLDESHGPSEAVYEADEDVLRPGHTCNSLYIVKQGTALAFRTNESGDESVVAEFSPGDTFGQVPTDSSEPVVLDHGVRAREALTVLVLPAAEYAPVFAALPKLRELVDRGRE